MLGFVDLQPWLGTITLCCLDSSCRRSRVTLACAHAKERGGRNPSCAQHHFHVWISESRMNFFASLENAIPKAFGWNIIENNLDLVAQCVKK